MKFIVYLLASATLVAALPQNPQEAVAVNAAPESQAAPSAQPKAAPVAPVNPFGAGFFGPGINNPHAIQPDQGLIDVARQIIQSNPNLRARVLNTGVVEITDEFGVRRNVVDAFGNNPLEAFDPEERFELEQERREQQLEFQQRQERLRLRQQLLQLQLGQLNQGGSAPAAQSASTAGGNRFFVSA